MKSKCSSAHNRKRPIVGICWFFFSSLTVFFPCRWSLSSSLPSASPPSSYFSIELHQLFSVAPVLATACVFTPDVEVCCFSNRLFSFSLSFPIPSSLHFALFVPPSFVVAHVHIKPLILFSPVRHRPPSAPPAPNPPPPPLHCPRSAPNASLLLSCS